VAMTVTSMPRNLSSAHEIDEKRATIQFLAVPQTESPSRSSDRLCFSLHASFVNDTIDNYLGWVGKSGPEIKKGDDCNWHPVNF
jgi:hypothetical protein